jgi:GTPase involved in cell partitioning and DNA repair
MTELEKSDYSLLEKPMLTVLSKSDLLDPEDISLYVDYFKEKNIDMMVVSSFSRTGIEPLIESIYRCHAASQEEL